MFYEIHKLTLYIIYKNAYFVAKNIKQGLDNHQINDSGCLWMERKIDLGRKAKGTVTVIGSVHGYSGFSSKHILWI